MTKIYIFYLSFVAVILLSTLAIGQVILVDDNSKSNVLVVPENLLAVKTWVGTTSEWSLPSNWSPSGVPDTRDDVNIPTLPASGNMPTISSGNFYVRKLIISSAAVLTQIGGSLTTSGDISIYGSFIQSSGTFTTTRSQTDVAGGYMSIGGTFSVTDFNVTAKGSINVSGTFTTNDNALIIEDATFSQSGGIVSTKDLEIKNGGIYNQIAGELNITHDLIVSISNIYSAIGGVVRFSGNQGGRSDYSGSVQFNDVIIDAAGKLNLNKDTDNIKIGGNLINNSTSLDNNKGFIIFNGTSPQTIYSASNPAASRTLAGSLIINNNTGVTLLSDLGIQTGFFYNSGGFLTTNDYSFYVNGVMYNGPLPVELSSFSASIIGSNVKLIWKTATELNNYGFEVERYAISAERQAWEKIGFVNGNGNSNSPKNYSYEDKNVTAGNYSYRLKQIDNDGQFEYSKIIEVDLGVPTKFELSQNYPNPFNPTTRIKFSLPEAGNVKLTLFNVLGQEVKILANESKESGVHIINFDASDLNSGIYVYKLEAGAFTQTRKMTLLK